VPTGGSSGAVAGGAAAAQLSSLDGLDGVARSCSRDELDKLREVLCESISTELLSPGFLPDTVCVSAWCKIMGVSRNYLFLKTAMHAEGRAAEYYARMGGTCAADFGSSACILPAVLADLDVVEKMDYETGEECACQGSLCFCRRLPLEALKRGRDDYVGNKRYKGRNVQLMGILWHSSLHQPSDLSEDYVHQWLGVSVRKIRAMRALAQGAVDAGDYKLERAILHGSVAKAALNKFPPHVKASIATFLDVHTRTDPTRPRLICTSQEMHGVSGMYEQLSDFFPEVVVSKTTFFRYVREILTDKGLEPRIKATKGDHNVCYICKVLNERRSELSMAIKKCDLDLASWQTGTDPPSGLHCGIGFQDRQHLSNYRELLQAEWDKADKMFAAHETLDKDMRLFLRDAVVAAQSAEKAHPGGGDGADSGVGWRSRDTMRVIHVDDRR